MVLTNVNSNTASQRKFLLVVDSNNSSSAGIKALLKQFRYKVWSVNTAAEALELSDIVMPALVIARQVEDMTHVDFIREFKRLDSSGKASVLVVTSGKDTVVERACLAAGAFTCLKLPLNVETLYRTIQVAIEPVPRMNLRINTALPVVINDKTGAFRVTSCYFIFALELPPACLPSHSSNPDDLLSLSEDTHASLPHQLYDGPACAYSAQCHRETAFPRRLFRYF